DWCNSTKTSSDGDRKPVTGGTVGGWKNLDGVCKQGTVINVQANVNGTGEAQVLRLGFNRGVCKHESHGHERTNNHGTSSAKLWNVTDATGNDWTENGAHVDNEVVSVGLTEVVFSGASGGQVDWQEGVEEWVCKTNERPGEEDHRSGEGHLLSVEKRGQMES